jgi:transposase
MNSKISQEKNQVINNNPIVKALSREEISRRIAEIQDSLKASTWKELETKGKFTKDDKLTFITDDMLIIGCDVGSETHYARAIDLRGREFSRKPFSFRNDHDGFQSAKQWALDLAARHQKKQIVLGLEPTGHYWFCLAAWMVSNGISVVQVNPYAVKQTKELEDNSQLKDDRKDPKLIANLVKDGNYGMPYLPEDVYAELRRLSRFKDQLSEDRIRAINRLHKEMAIYFPEYKDAFGKIESAFALEVLKEAPFPEDILAIGADGLRDIWRRAGLKGRGYGRAGKIVDLASGSVGLVHGTQGGRKAVRWSAAELERLNGEIADTEEMLHTRCREIPSASNVLEIRGIGENILSGILSEMGDISRFDDAKEIQKMSGLSLVSSSSGKHRGDTKISRRGRKRLRYWLFQAARSSVAYADEFRALHIYYTTRKENPLKKMQSLIVIACKLLRIIYTLLRTGRSYDPSRMLGDIHRPAEKTSVA